MEIRQFRVVVRAKNFERTCRFYGESLSLPRLQSWDGETSRGATYQAGAGTIERASAGRLPRRAPRRAAGTRSSNTRDPSTR